MPSMHIEQHGQNKLTRAALLGLLLGLAACNSGAITSVKLHDATQQVCDETGTTCGVADTETHLVQVSGHGTCGKVGVNFGDGRQAIENGDFASKTPPQFILFQNRYSDVNGAKAWPGVKTVHAFSAESCVGEAKMQVNVLLESTNAAGNKVFKPKFDVGLGQPTPTACNAVPNTRPLRKGDKLFLTEIPGSPKVNFGCVFNGCIAGIDGDASSANASFPFPSLKAHSLVLRIASATGTQLVQGERFTNFTVSENGPLELCVNDDVLRDNTGAWGIQLSVDETGAE